MLDAGSVLTVGELGLQRTLEKEKSKLDDTDAPLISFSPNIGKKKHIFGDFCYLNIFP